MIYFSYNDYSDCKENGKIDVIRKLEEEKEIYEVQSGTIYLEEKENKIIKKLRNKTELEQFYKNFLGINDIEDLKNIAYCRNEKILGDSKNILVSKIKNKEIFVLIKVLDSIDNNIPYKMFELSYNLIQNWYTSEEKINKRYPIVIPVVIYTGTKEWKIGKKNINEKLNYTTFQDNKIIFSYNIVNAQELNKKRNNTKK